LWPIFPSLLRPPDLGNAKFDSRSHVHGAYAGGAIAHHG
jgi:hypothetical protein